MRQLEHVFMIEGPNRDTVAHARENASDIFDGFALAEPYFFLAEHDGRSAEMLHGAGEAAPRAQAGLLKNHPQHPAGQKRLVAAGAFLLLLETPRHIEE